MADKRKEGTEQPRRRRGGEEARPAEGRRRRGGEAGRIAVRPDTVAYRRAAVDEHAQQVREQIEAALVEARRLRADIEGRIDERLAKEEEPGEGGKARVVTKVTAKARLRPVRRVTELEPPGRRGPR